MQVYCCPTHSLRRGRCRNWTKWAPSGLSQQGCSYESCCLKTLQFRPEAQRRLHKAQPE